MYAERRQRRRWTTKFIEANKKSAFFPSSRPFWVEFKVRSLSPVLPLPEMNEMEEKSQF